jgi:hypothetical protein
MPTERQVGSSSNDSYSNDGLSQSNLSKKNTTRQIMVNYFELSAPSQFTATMPLYVETDYGLTDMVIEFSDESTKTVNVILNFLFEAPANYFWQYNDIEIAGDLLLNNIPVSVGTIIDMDYVFDTEENFLGFVRNFYADNRVDILYK